MTFPSGQSARQNQTRRHDLPWADGQVANEMIRTFANQTRGVTLVVLLGVDGLAIAAFPGHDRDQIDRTAAAAGSLIALANAMGSELGAGYLEILTFRTPNMHFLFMDVADLAALAVVAGRDSDLGVIGHQMQRLVAAIGDRFSVDPRRVPGTPAVPSSGR